MLTSYKRGLREYIRAGRAIELLLEGGAYADLYNSQFDEVNIYGVN